MTFGDCDDAFDGLHEEEDGREDDARYEGEMAF